MHTCNQNAMAFSRKLGNPTIRCITISTIRPMPFCKFNFQVVSIEEASIHVNGIKCFAEVNINNLMNFLNCYIFIIQKLSYCLKLTSDSQT